MSLTSDIKESYSYNLDIRVKTLCDSHDELERQLKIVEDALIVGIKSLENATHTKVFSTIILKQAFEQIRGNE